MPPGPFPWPWGFSDRRHTGGSGPTSKQRPQAGQKGVVKYKYREDGLFNGLSRADPQLPGPVGTIPDRIHQPVNRFIFSVNICGLPVSMFWLAVILVLCLICLFISIYVVYFQQSFLFCINILISF